MRLPRNYTSTFNRWIEITYHGLPSVASRTFSKRIVSDEFLRTRGIFETKEDLRCSKLSDRRACVSRTYECLREVLPKWLSRSPFSTCKEQFLRLNWCFRSHTCAIRVMDYTGVGISVHIHQIHRIRCRSSGCYKCPYCEWLVPQVQY